MVTSADDKRIKNSENVTKINGIAFNVMSFSTQFISCDFPLFVCSLFHFSFVHFFVEFYFVSIFNLFSTTFWEHLTFVKLKAPTTMTTDDNNNLTTTNKKDVHAKNRKPIFTNFNPIHIWEHFHPIVIQMLAKVLMIPLG